MIHQVLKCIEDDLNNYFKIKFPGSTSKENKVVLSNMTNPDGSIGVQGSEKIILSLFNIEKEPVLNNGGMVNSAFTAGSNPPLNLNIYIIFAAYFTGNKYHDGLKFISYIIGYFQKKMAYTKSNTPELAKIDGNVEKLIFELCYLNVDQTNSVWAAIGSKLMPFVMYKVRTLSFDESIMKESRPLISDIES